MKQLLLTFLFCQLYFFITAQKVGIGTTSPQQQLSVAGALNIDQGNANIGTIANSLSFGNLSREGIGSRRSGTPNSNGIDFYTNYMNRMIISNDGRVGIGGILSPIEQVHIYDSINTGFPFYVESNHPQFADLAINSRNNTAGIGIAYYRNAGYLANTYLNVANDYQIDLAGFGNVFSAKQNGNVGIAISNPTQKFQVNNGAVALSNSTDSKIWAINYDQPNGYFYFDEFGAGRRFTIKNGGNIGVQGVTNPGFPLNFANSLGDKISLYGNSATHYGFGISANLLQIHSDIAGSDVAIGYGSSGAFTENVRFKGNGNVGIGVNNPAQKLEVSGNIKSTGDIIVQTDKAIIRSNASIPLKMVPFSGPYGATIGPGVVNIGTIFFEAFSGTPTIHIANWSGTGDMAKVVVTISNVTNSSCSVNFYNPSSSSIAFNGTFNFVATGPQ